MNKEMNERIRVVEVKQKLNTVLYLQQILEIFSLFLCFSDLVSPEVNSMT